MLNIAPGSLIAYLEEVFPDVSCCDNDAFECFGGHGKPDHFMCCLCYQESAAKFGPRDYEVDLCELCRDRAATSQP